MNTSMRKYLAVALAGVIAFGVVSIATADESVQTEEGKILPKKLPKKGSKNVKLKNTITTFNAPGEMQPKSASRTILDLPKQIKVNLKSVKFCKTNASGLGLAATTSDAKKACGSKSQVSKDKGSSAVVTVAGVGEIDVEVTAFNESGKKLLLFSKPVGSFSSLPASILVGKLKKSKSGKKYKKALDVTIPPLAAGAISFFEVTIKKGKFLRGKCKPKKMHFRAKTFFTDGTTTVDKDMSKCKPKK
ncbi:MAG: hypothetical protein WBC01_10070 [Solirubrobacterales bacterium]